MMDDSEKMATIRQLAAEINAGNIGAIRQHMASEFYNHAPAGDEPGASDVFFDLAVGLKAAFPDLHVEVADLAADGDRLTGQLTISGMQTAVLWGVPPSGEPFTWTAPVSFRFVGDRFAVNWDGMTPRGPIGLGRALRLVPPPEDMDKPLRFPLDMPEHFYRLIFTGQVADKPCSHLHLIQVTEPATDVCEECVALGDVWPQLRMCLICGYVGCCDTSKNKHMKQHYEKTGHSIFRSIFRSDGWIWCYEDNAFRSKRTLEQYRR